MTGLIIIDTNCLIVTPTHDAYLDNGTDIGLTVGMIIIAFKNSDVNNSRNISKGEIQKYILEYYFFSAIQYHRHIHLL
jgi:hypothetical protein